MEEQQPVAAKASAGHRELHKKTIKVRRIVALRLQRELRAMSMNIAAQQQERESRRKTTRSNQNIDER